MTEQSRPEHSRVRQRLQAAAAEHRPDRARMLARFTAGVAESGRRPHPRAAARSFTGRVRAAGVAAGLVGALVTGAVVGDRMTGAEPPQTVRVASPPTRSAPPSRSAPPPSTAPPLADGALRAAGEVGPGSNRYWAQSNVRIDTGVRLTALTIELRVARNGGVRSTGSWQTAPAGDFRVSVHDDRGALVYRWTLRNGRTVAPGKYVFAGQYDHAEGERKAAGDSWTATGAGPRGPLSVHGGFP